MPSTAGPRPLRDLWTQVDDDRWYARVSNGDRRHPLPVVLVHGFGISSSYFVPLAERLAPRFTVYAPDLPGHGRSDTPAKPLDIPGLAAALRRWLLAMRFERVSIVANSMGCQVAAELAAGSPELIDRLVLIGPTMDSQARNLRRTLPRFVLGGLHERKSMTLLLVKDYARMGPRLFHELRAMFGHAIEEILPQVAAPIVFVRGEHDRVVPQRWVDELAALTPQSRVIVMPGAAHAAHYSHADELAVHIGNFLEPPQQIPSEIM